MYNSVLTTKSTLYMSTSTINHAHISLSPNITDMDWFTWLSKTSLDPTLVYEYGLTFAHNELEQEDISYFNHEFLQSMGISIAKHRLEVLKLAKKEKVAIPYPMSRILIAIKRTKRRFSKYLRVRIPCEDSALAIVPARSQSTRWKNGVVKRNMKLVVSANKHARAPLLLANGSPKYFCSSRVNSFSSPLASEFQKDDDYWCDVEEIRWETMFQNLKPT